MPLASNDVAPAFSLKGLGKSFAGVFACSDINIDIWPGEVVAICGENGSGKSTTMKCFFGLYAPDQGGIQINGKAVKLSSPRDAEAFGISMIPQELDLFPELSIVENLFIGRNRPRTFWGGFDWKTMRERACGILKRLGVPFDVSMPVKELSAANAKLIEIARALNRDARVIIMDEPTAALTEHEAHRLFSVIRGLTIKGVSVVYISHRLDEIFEISNKIVVLRDGRQIISAPTKDFTVSSLVQAMVGRPLSQLYARQPHFRGNLALAVSHLTLKGRFRDVSFEVHAGEVLGLAGLIGAGRSEVAQAIFGMYPADSGTISIDGKSLSIKAVQDAQRHGIAYLPEERRSQGLILQASIKENISFAVLGNFSRLGFVSRQREREFALKSAQRFTVVGAPLAAPVEVLSGGNQQKVLIAKTLATNPRIVILDEPTRGVDVGAKAEIYKIIDELARTGKAVILISSEMNEVLSLSDRIIVMHEGRLTGEFSRDSFSAEAIGAAAANQGRSYAR